MKLKELIPPERILLNIQATSSKQVISAMVKLLAEQKIVTDPEAVEKAILEREQQLGTGIGHGVAIPHAEPGDYKNPIVIFGRTEKPVDFRAPDGQKAQLIFLLLTPEETPALHVRLLARICRLTRSKDLRAVLMNVKTPDEAAQAIAQLETDFPELTP